MSPEELAEACREKCAHCKAGYVARWRADTREFVHDYGTKPFFSHTICGASDLRKANQNG